MKKSSDNNKASQLINTTKPEMEQKSSNVDKFLKWLPVLSLVFAGGGAWATIHFTEKSVDKLDTKVESMGQKLNETRETMIQIKQKVEDFMSNKK